jgi:Uncharacterised protein family (UPF0175)
LLEPLLGGGLGVRAPLVLSPKWYSLNVQITLNIPDGLAERLIAGGKDPAEATLEALAVEGYRTETLSESEIRQMLGFETRMEVHAFLKEHGIFLHYSLADAQNDRKSAIEVRSKQQNIPDSGERTTE